MKELAIKRQKGSQVLELTSWAIYHKAEFRHLVVDITTLINNIKELFPEPQAQIALTQQEATELGNRSPLSWLRI